MLTSTGKKNDIHTHIGNLNMAFLIQKNVVQLQIPIDDALLVQVEQTDRDLGSVEAGDRLFKSANLHNLIHEIATVDELHYEEEPIGGLKARV